MGRYSSMKTVLAHGIFDLLHSGHAAHLMQARGFGDRLVVSVLADAFVAKHRKPINDEIERAFMVGALGCVDQVIICKAEGPSELLRILKPSIYVRNDEYLTQDKPEYSVCHELGIKLGFTRTVAPHTSELIDKIRNHK